MLTYPHSLLEVSTKAAAQVTLTKRWLSLMVTRTMMATIPRKKVQSSGQSLKA
jgi:hypothetical protein